MYWKRAKEIEAARAFARKAHSEAGCDPYFLTHLDDVDLTLFTFGYGDPQTRQAGFLHDTLEDCEQVTPEVLAEAGFSAEVIRIVRFCSDEEPPLGVKWNRKTKKAVTYNRMCQERRQANALWRQQDSETRIWGTSWHHRAIRVKLADRLSNIRACIRDTDSRLNMYHRERRAFFDALHQTDIADSMWYEYHRLLRHDTKKRR